MAYGFGQDFTFWFYPLVGDQPANVPAAMQGQTPAIYVFPDTVPTRDAAINGTGAIQSITTWTWDAGKNGWSFTVDGIDDPDPDGSTYQRTYWIAINFLLSSGEQSQCVLRSIEMERAGGHQTSVDVTDDDLRAYYPQIDAYSTVVQRKNHITNGLSQVKSALRAKGIEWGKVTRPDRVREAVCYRALALFFLSQAQGNDKFAALYEEYKSLYQIEIDGLSLEYDNDNDGEPDVKAETANDGALIVR